jgi:uncharacterized protein
VTVHPPSPCKAICVLDADTGWCQGCWRTMEEISHWMLYSPEEKLAVLRRIGERRITSAPVVAPRR